MVARKRSSSSHARVARQSLELSLAAPQVVAHRVARMATASMSPTLSDRDRREFTRMGAEKLQAMQESWVAMGLQAWRAQFTFAQAWMSSLMRMSTLPWMRVSSQVMGAGMAPVHRRAVANAKRLRRG